MCKNKDTRVNKCIYAILCCPSYTYISIPENSAQQYSLISGQTACGKTSKQITLIKQKNQEDETCYRRQKTKLRLI